MMIRFHGAPESLAKWRGLVAGVTGKAGTEPALLDWLDQSRGVRRDFFDVDLTAAERETLQRGFWYEESGTGGTATGRPYRWNDCIGYEELREKTRRPATARA